MPGRAARPTRKPTAKSKNPSGRKQSANMKPAKKAPAKKAPVPAKKAPVPAKKAPAPVKKAPVKKAPVKKAPAPVKKAPVKKAPVPVKKAPVKKAPVPAKKVPAPVEKAPAKRLTAAKPTPARDALQALAAKRAITQTLTPLHNDSGAVDAYFRDVDHPFKAEMEAVRAIILGVSDKISERIKWNAPSFFYKEDLGAFHPRATEYAHLILLFPNGAGMDQGGNLLEGNHKDRREAKFHSMDDVKAKKRGLEKLIKNWVALRDA